MANHYPLIGRNVPRSCGAAGDTANPWAAITCPSCRARLERKVANEEVEAAAHPATSQEHRFHAGTADYYRRILSGDEQLSARAA